ncbi:ATP-grasp domain-containing protein [Streptomyces sp. NPDC088190]|uniref:preATP grasp domain-containing protein n=1 Tax=unclassified Streptomyces TaxID=2593676 RepID=UPI002E782738|nr:ATP-grasp domain-containing protein [Streptomyces sp. JV190]MEE1838761.1 ATP-grasp domain-containing protein [Streptomyces sp. JV190]
MGFADRLKRHLVEDENARFIYLNNFEVERSWAAGEPKLPGAGISFASATVNRMEEMGVLLAERADIVLLKLPMDSDYAVYLRAIDASAGQVVAVERSLPSRTVTEDALESPRTLDFLRGLADGRTYLMPMGISTAEEELSDSVGLPLAGPRAEICKRVNGKIYSRRLVDSLGLTAVPGTVCERVSDLADAIEAQGARRGRAVVKESLGVSGRGMVVLRDRNAAGRLLRLIGRRGQQARVDMVVESWIEDVTDLNYQFLVSRSGVVRFETVKESVLHNNVHQGHRFPVQISDEHLATLHESAQLIGRALYADGYYGVVGVDAMIGPDGTLYPCLEINARFNMSTYQGRIAERFVSEGRHAIAATFNFKQSRAHSFAEVAATLGQSMFDGTNAPGVLVNNFATLNAGVTAGVGPFHGRIYGICIADDRDSALALRSRSDERLRTLMESESS